MRLDIDPKFVFMESINEDGLIHQDMAPLARQDGLIITVKVGYADWLLDTPLRLCGIQRYEKIQPNAVRWLMKDRTAFNRGVNYLLDSQYSNGGFPQFFLYMSINTIRASPIMMAR
ncbi:hypothetical protein CMK12_13790 [Candidatus Poribacteria bacterium]|jgi:hypothetical protein|nr:hypothetical protein [Candidatus Poribacteria bacterium]